MSDQDVPKDFNTKDFLTSFVRTAKAVLLSPKTFYDGMETKGGLGNPFLFLLCCVAVHTGIASLFVGKHPFFGFNVAYALVMPFVTAGILFLIITKLFKASGTFEMAFRVNAYAAATALLSWVAAVFKVDPGGAPGAVSSVMALLGLVFEFYRLYLIAIGLSRTFSITASRAAVAIILTAIIYIFTLGPLMKAVMGPQQSEPLLPGGAESSLSSLLQQHPYLTANAKLPETCSLKT